MNQLVKNCITYLICLTILISSSWVPKGTVINYNYIIILTGMSKIINLPKLKKVSSLSKECNDQIRN